MQPNPFTTFLSPNYNKLSLSYYSPQILFMNNLPLFIIIKKTFTSYNLKNYFYEFLIIYHIKIFNNIF